MSTLTRYLLLQIPGWLAAILILLILWEWAGLSAWLAALLFTLYVVKDLAFYPLVRKAYETDSRSGPERLAGCIGVTRQRLDPAGYVRVRGELWRAEVVSNPPVESGTFVRVTGARGFTLLVTTETADGDPA